MTPPLEAVAPTLAAPQFPDLAGLEPIERIKRRWPMVLAAVVTLLMIGGLARELLGEGLQGLSVTVPQHPLYYVAFALFYLGPPVFDWVIFRRLWGLPMAGMAALFKKRVANEVIVGYSGEAYFYAWARDRLKMVASPFGAVKDVTILSAMAGNAITLAMLAIALPIAKDLFTEAMFETVSWSALAVVVTSLPFLIFSKRVFSLAKATLWWVFAMHCIRLVFGSVMIALAWHFAMPDVSIGMWLFLAAGRLLVSRLPLVPNKDLLFANFAIILIGQGEALSELIAFTAALTLLAHVVSIAGFGASALLGKRR